MTGLQGRGGLLTAVARRHARGGSRVPRTPRASREPPLSHHQATTKPPLSHAKHLKLMQRFFFYFPFSLPTSRAARRTSTAELGSGNT